MEQIETELYTLPGRQLSTEEKAALPGYLERLAAVLPVKQGAEVREILVHSDTEGTVIGCYVVDLKRGQTAKPNGFIPGLRLVKKERLLH